MRIREKSTPVNVIKSESVGMEIFPNPAQDDFFVKINACFFAILILSLFLTEYMPLFSVVLNPIEHACAANSK
jgi:hypothetical protein